MADVMANVTNNNNIRVDTITVTSAGDALAKLSAIENPHNTLILITEATCNELQRIAYPRPQPYNNPYGKVKNELSIDIKIFDCYTVKVVQMNSWWQIRTIISNGKDISFAAEQSDRIVVVSMRDFDVTMTRI